MFRALYIGITRTKVLTMNAVVMALVNVLLDYILIFGKFGMPEMGIKGAAIASVMAEAASLAFFLIYTYAKVDFKKFGLNHWQKIDFSLLGRILSISCFTMVQYFWPWLLGLSFHRDRTVGATRAGDCQYRT